MKFLSKNFKLLCLQHFFCGNFDLSTNPFFILKSTKAPDKKDKRTTRASAVDQRKSGSKRERGPDESND